MKKNKHFLCRGYSCAVHFMRTQPDISLLTIGLDMS